MKYSELKSKRVLVVGLGITGMSVVRYLSRCGVDFEIADEHTVSHQTPGLDDSIVKHPRFTPEVFCEFDVIVLSPGIPRAHPAVVAALQVGVLVIGDIELFADAVSVPVIAITGSNGKSTVVAWLTQVINHCDVKAVACGNIGEPALDSLLSDADVLVLELSSYQLESTSSLRPVAAAVLNVTEDHLDRYENIEHYAATKRRVYKNAQYCLANHDDVRTWPQPDEASSADQFSLTVVDDASICWHRSDIENISLALPGEHNVANALVVFALSSVVGLSVEQREKAIGRFTGLAHRSQFVIERSGVRWYNDSKGTNVDACKKAVAAMPGPVILIAGGIGKGADFSQLQDTVKKHVKLVLLIGQDKQLMHDQLAACTTAQMVETMSDAVSLASQQSVAGDVVLLSPACASFDMFKSFEDRGEQFVTAVHEVLAA